MKKITVSKILGNKIYDESGKEYENIGNATHFPGESAYVLNNFVFGREKAFLAKPLSNKKKKGKPGFALIDSVEHSRIIDAMYYQPGLYDSYYGYSANTDFYIDENFELQEYDSISNVVDMLFPGYYNDSKSSILDYALIENNSIRLLTIIDDNVITQSGFLKCSTKNNTAAVENCELLINNSNITCFDRTYTVVNASYTSSTQNYLYLSQYEQAENLYADDVSTLYDGTTVNDLSIDDGIISINFDDVLADALRKSIDIAEIISAKPSKPQKIWPSDNVRKQPNCENLYFEICDEKYNRIDDALDENANNLQVSNIKAFEICYNLSEQLECTIHLHVSSIAYVYIEHKNFLQEDVVEWCPVVVDNYYAYRINTESFECVHHHYNSHFLSHTMYAEIASSDTDKSGVAHIANENNTTPYSTTTVEYQGKSYNIHAYKLGSLEKNMNNIYKNDVQIIEKTYIVRIDDYFYFDSADKCIKKYSDDSIQLQVKNCEFGTSLYKDLRTLLIDNHAYLLKDEQFLKVVDLSNLFDANYQALNVALVHTEDIEKIYKEVR